MGSRMGYRGRAGVLVPATGVLAAGAVAWFLVNLDGPRGPQFIGWLPGPLAMFLAAAALRRVATTAGLAPAARRFWNQIALCTAAVGLGATVEAFGRIVAPVPGLDAVPGMDAVTPGTGVAAQQMPWVSLDIHMIAVLMVLWALIRLPAGSRTRGEWVRLILDGATVMLGAVLFGWYLTFGPLLSGTDGPNTIWGALAVGVLTQVALAAVVKVVLAGSGPVDGTALRLLGCTLLVGTSAIGLTTLLVELPHLTPSQVVMAPVAFTAACAGVAQRRALTRGAATTSVPHRAARPYSLLPYLAVAATYVLLLIVTATAEDARVHVVVVGAVAITSLVVVRQLAAFHDNAHLVDTLRQHKERLRHQASHDELTQLANRTLFAERVTEVLAARVGAGGVAALLIDLDDFKTVNDTLGHGVGDALLVAVAERLRSCVRPGDTVARLGGDEFAVLLVDAGTEPAEVGVPAGADGVVTVTERILASLAQPFLAHGHSLLIRASIGIADAEPDEDPERLLRNADIAMYTAKEHGKFGYARYTTGMHKRIMKQAQLGAQLSAALDAGQLRLLYQPIVALPDGDLAGVEALVRWQHPERGVLSPDEFIPAAERTGLIVQLGRWVLREACRQYAAWRAAHPDAAPITLAVNVAARQLQESTFAAEVAGALREFRLSPQALVVEVTETAVLKGGPIVQTLEELHDLGVRLALDDFGTGQSSLGLLRTVPVDTLKLDKSFVENVTGAQQHAAVATAIVQMAQALGLDAVAEGIETAAQAERLTELGYRLGQGFHFGGPLPADRVEALLAVGAALPVRS